MTKLLETIKMILVLMKIKITSFVTITTFLGYILYKHKINIDVIGVLIGVLILSSGSAIFNHFQERNFDALMKRTQSRPIPSGKVNPSTALVLAFMFSISGLIILYVGYNFLTALFGLLALVWYNLIYTPLKRRFALAVVPGSLIGSIPPIIGYVSAGGNPFDHSILMVAFFLFIWQIPHFWLLMLFFDSDYKLAGYPTLTDYFTIDQIYRLTFIWMISLAIASLLMPIFGLIENEITNYCLLLTALWFIWKSRILITHSDERKILISGFRTINAFVLLVVFQLSIDKIL